ncbi:MAG: hypothetical protein Udaeo2_12530 [Candidatus Udaeobacter sp.]|nr:MAG: hypothetical protein Udaeo2_12530 [Candidatus Udaeobacter sp.]
MSLSGYTDHHARVLIKLAPTYCDAVHQGDFAKRSGALNLRETGIPIQRQMRASRIVVGYVR